MLRPLPWSGRTWGRFGPHTATRSTTLRSPRRWPRRSVPSSPRERCVVQRLQTPGRRPTCPHTFHTLPAFETVWEQWTSFGETLQANAFIQVGTRFSRPVVEGVHQPGLNWARVGDTFPSRNKELNSHQLSADLERGKYHFDEADLDGLDVSWHSAIKAGDSWFIPIFHGPCFWECGMLSRDGAWLEKGTVYWHADMLAWRKPHRWPVAAT